MISVSGIEFELNGGDLDITLIQGDTLGFSFQLNDDGVPMDVTGFTAEMILRRSPRDPDIYLRLATDNDRIVMGTRDGLVYVRMTAAEMAELRPASGVWAIKIRNPNDTDDDPDGRVITGQSGAWRIKIQR